MNDENSVFENTEASPYSTCDTLETDDAAEGNASSHTSEKQAPTGTDEAATGIFADTGADSDSNCKGSDSSPQEGELEQLRGELKQLREEIARRDTHAKQEDRISREYTEFCALYPSVAVRSLPEEVWQDVKNGSSLAAAYALAERRRAVSLQKATDSNANNRARSAGAVNNAESIEFSPSEVRAMTSEEVRANLPKIMRSMQKWH